MGIQQPLEVVVFEVADVLVLELFCNLNGLVPSMELLIHLHGFFNLVILDQDGFCLVELLEQDSKLGLDSEVVNALARNHLVEFTQVVRLRHVAQCCVAAFSDVQVMLLKSQLGQCLPVGFGLRRQLERLEDFDGTIEPLILERSSELNQGLVESVRDGRRAIVNQNLRLVVTALDAFDVTFDLVHRHLVRLFD